MSGLLLKARSAAALSQGELARRAGTSRPTLSAYEHGHKSPTLDTALRLVHAADQDLDLVRRITFTYVPLPRGRVIPVPSSLRRLPIEQAMSKVDLPLHLNWSQPGRVFDLADRRDRARVYEIVLREGTAEDILTYLDGALLCDLWTELTLPRSIRAAWAPVITARR